jgi:GNAT superfamily N-acetyltransferase
LRAGELGVQRAIRSAPSLQSSIPRLTRQSAWRDDYIFAITVKEGSSLQVAPAGDTKISNRITSTEGYLGNIALSLETEADQEHDHSHCGGHGHAHSHIEPDPALSPQRGTVWVQPSFSDCSRAKLIGKMFYELHPQLWGQGIASEAFAEVLRFAFEEVGCTLVSVDPTAGNDASVRVCERFGLVFSHESANNAWGKPQLFHTISRDTWFRRYRPGKPVEGAWTGKEVCRWCADMRTRPPMTCTCGWAKYCSRECQRADWVVSGGHKSDCGKE